MKYCVHCGKEVDNEAVVCPHCGCLCETTDKTNRLRVAKAVRNPHEIADDEFNKKENIYNIFNIIYVLLMGIAVFCLFYSIVQGFNFQYTKDRYDVFVWFVNWTNIGGAKASVAFSVLAFVPGIVTIVYGFLLKNNIKVFSGFVRIILAALLIVAAVCVYSVK